MTVSVLPSNNHACASLPPHAKARGAGLAAICGLPPGPERTSVNRKGSQPQSVYAGGCGRHIFRARLERRTESASVPWPREVLEPVGVRITVTAPATPNINPWPPQRAFCARGDRTDSAHASQTIGVRVEGPCLA